MAVDWSSLPTDLLGTIAIKLETIVDFIYFSSVCRSWNHASSAIKHLWEGTPYPWLLLEENNKENPDYIRKVFNPNNKKFYKLYLPDTFGARCWGSPYGWIAMVTRDLNVQLINPITTKAKLHFPSLKTLPNLPPYFEGTHNGEDYYQWFLRDLLIRLIVVKVSYDNNDNEFIIMALYDTCDAYDSHDRYCNLVFARHGNQSWTPIPIKQNPKYLMVDLVTMDDNVYGLYENGTMVFWKVKEFLSSEPIKPVQFSLFEFEFHEVDSEDKSLETMYLVQSGSNLLLVGRLRYELESNNRADLDADFAFLTFEFLVDKFNFTNKRWEETNDVGDVALFVGYSYSMSVPSVGRLKSNCIYFVDDEPRFWELPTKPVGRDIGVYDIESGKIQPLFHTDDTRSLIPPTWFIPRF